MQKLAVAPKLLVVILAAYAAAACAGEWAAPSSPSSVAAADLSAKPSSGGTTGVYDLSFAVFHNGVYTEVSTLPVKSDELILKAYITDSAGQPAQKGTVTFQYCSYKKGPSNDIDRPDEAPKEACADGSADWARLASKSVTEGSCPLLGIGFACVNFGVVQIPRTVGFRIRYEPQGSGITAGTSEPENFTWVEAS